jgi:hypothetical protein
LAQHTLSCALLWRSLCIQLPETAGDLPDLGQAQKVWESVQRRQEVVKGLVLKISEELGKDMSSEDEGLSGADMNTGVAFRAMKVSQGIQGWRCFTSTSFNALCIRHMRWDKYHQSTCCVSCVMIKTDLCVSCRVGFIRILTSP